MKKYLIIIFLFLSQIVLSGPSDSTRFNFDYTDGEEPWENHISTKINTTFEEALIKKTYLQKILCGVDSIHNEKIPFSGIQSICLKGQGRKMVVPMGYPSWSHLIFELPHDIGLLEQKHMTKRYPTHFYDKSKFSTKYFLLPFEDYEIPTFHPLESEIYLPIWKQAFQKINKIDDDYFSEHIRIISTTVNKKNMHSVEKSLYFRVVYYFNVDWIKIKLEDNFKIGLPRIYESELVESTLFKDSLDMFEQMLISEKQIKSKYIHKISIKIASKDEIISAITSASKLFTFNVNRNLRLTREGKFIGDLFGVVDEEANKCIQAKLFIENATVSKISTCSCWVN